MRPFPARAPAPALALTLIVIAAGALATAMAPGRDLPPIVFVSRNPVAGAPGAVPGLGPHDRTAITGGRLLVREPDGRVRELLEPGRFRDVSDPSVSPDARTIAFAAVEAGDSTWRLYTVAPSGAGVRRLGALALPGDDFDPCWVDDTTLVFASTRGGARAQYADVPVSNLWAMRIPAGPGAMRRVGTLTSERNGAEEPAFDAARNEIVFSRWWFNRWRAAANASGITDRDERALPRDTVNLWHVMAMPLEGGAPRLAAADLRTRRGAMGYQPAVLADGSIVSVFAANLGLSPGPIATGLHRQARTFGGAQRLAGAIVSGRAGDSYAGTGGLAAPAACSPAPLPDGRVLFSYAPGARGDFGLHVMHRDGTRIAKVLDLPGTLELDAALLVPRPRVSRRDRPSGRREASPERLDRVTFRFHDHDVFADGAPGSSARGAPPRTPGARIRFFATVQSPAGRDTVQLVREVPIGERGEVNEILPASVPLFEQLVDSTGRVLMTAHGPAHVAGSNAGVPGTVTRCVGCHLGHSTLPVPDARRVAKRIRS